MSKTSEDLNFGPISKWEGVVPFDRLSKKAILLPSAYMTEEKRSLTFPQHILFRFLTLSQRTSYSTLLLTSWGLLLPALALNRVRLEQLIVSSYLIHEREDVGIKAFLEHMPISTYLNTEAAMSDSKVAKILGRDIDMEKVRQEAVKVMSGLKPGFDPSTDRFQRKWTNLDLRSMAKRRDEMAASSNAISKDPLERFYVTVYKDFSSVVHSDCLALSPVFLGDLVFHPENGPVLIPQFGWATQVSALNALFDIIQTYETMSFVGVDCLDTFWRLHGEWKSAASVFIK